MTKPDSLITREREEQAQNSTDNWLKLQVSLIIKKNPDRMFERMVDIPCPTCKDKALIKQETGLECIRCNNTYPNLWNPRIRFQERRTRTYENIEDWGSTQDLLQGKKITILR